MANEFYEEVRVDLTPAEQILKGRELSRINFAIGELEAQKSAATRSFGNQIKTLKTEGGAIAEDVRSGQESRQVRCYQNKRHGEMVIETIRSDTGQIVRTRAMLEHERQESLPYGDDDTLESRKPRKKKQETDESAH